MSGPSQSVSQATVDIGEVFVKGGFFGLVIYAVLLAFFLLLVRDFLKDYLIRSMQREQTATNLEVAKSLGHIAAELRALTVQTSIMMSAVGYQEFIRSKDRGELPKGGIGQ